MTFFSCIFDLDKKNLTCPLMLWSFELDCYNKKKKRKVILTKEKRIVGWWARRVGAWFSTIWEENLFGCHFGQINFPTDVHFEDWTLTAMVLMHRQNGPRECHCEIYSKNNQRSIDERYSLEITVLPPVDTSRRHWP